MGYCHTVPTGTKRLHVPPGTPENSPPIHRWVANPNNVRSPVRDERNAEGLRMPSPPCLPCRAPPPGLISFPSSGLVTHILQALLRRATQDFRPAWRNVIQGGSPRTVCERERSDTRAKRSFGDLRFQTGAWDRDRGVPLARALTRQCGVADRGAITVPRTGHAHRHWRPKATASGTHKCPSFVSRKPLRQCHPAEARGTLQSPLTQV